jgi:hypothetical protein
MRNNLIGCKSKRQRARGKSHPFILSAAATEETPPLPNPIEIPFRAC